MQKYEKQNLEEDDGYDKEMAPKASKLKSLISRASLAQMIFYKCSLCENSNHQFSNVEKHVRHNHFDHPEVRIIKIKPDGTIEHLEATDLSLLYTCDCGKEYRDKYRYANHCKEKNHNCTFAIRESVKRVKSSTQTSSPGTQSDPLRLVSEPLLLATQQEIRDAQATEHSPLETQTSAHFDSLIQEQWNAFFGTNEYPQ